MIRAFWGIELMCDCPVCEENVDLTEYDDFWSCGISPVEHGTERTTDMWVTCPACAHEFKVTTTY
jgi:C4-type Zn-finger protein